MNPVRNALIGLAIGDALGVPVEFNSRADLDDNPVKEMRAFGTYNQPKGTWSDDSSLTFCLAEALLDGVQLKSIAKNFVAWKQEAYWTAHNEVFDIGITTSKSIVQLDQILKSQDYEALRILRYGATEMDNGNGSLMRILPLYFAIREEGIEANFETIWEVSALTHGHIRSAIACLIYLILADELYHGKGVWAAYEAMQIRVQAFFKNKDIVQRETTHFDRLILHNINDLERSEIKSSGYVIDSLEAAIWCLLEGESYSETVLLAVNLGRDTDTIAAIAGGLAGLHYGNSSFPKDWYNSLARLADIEQLCDKLWQHAQ